jgi:hypothetical protein
MVVEATRRHAERAKQRVVKRFGPIEVIGADHNVRKHPVPPHIVSPCGTLRRR